MKVLLRAGHGGYDGGAVNPRLGLKEKDLTLELVLKIGSWLERWGIKVIYSRKTDVGNILATTQLNQSPNYVLEVHFNAGGGTGAELYAPGRESVAISNYYLQQALSKYFKWRGHKVNMIGSGFAVRNIKVKNGIYVFDKVFTAYDYYGTLRNSYSRGIAADFLEVAFIDNDNDMKIYKSIKDELAKDIASSIMVTFNKKVPS